MHTISALDTRNQILDTRMYMGKTRRKQKPAPKQTPIRGIIKISLMFILIMIAYLIVLPLITAQFIPCLANHPFTSYTSNQCTVEGALDQFMKLALIGLSVLTLFFLAVLKRYLKIAPFHDMKTWTKIPSQKILFLNLFPSS